MGQIAPTRIKPGIETRVSRVENDVSTLKQTLADNRKATASENEATHDLIKELIEAVGKPENGPGQPASGVYWAVDAVSSRLRPFEQRWEQVKGGLTTLAAVGAPIAAILWFLEGDKVAKIFHG